MPRIDRFIWYLTGSLRPAALPVFENPCQTRLGFLNHRVVVFASETVVPPRLALPNQDYSQQSRTTHAPANAVEHDIRSAPLLAELRAYAIGRKHRAAADACCPCAPHGARRYLKVVRGLEDLEFHLGWLALGSPHPISQCSLSVRLLGQPERPQQRNLRSTRRRLAPGGPRPQVRNRSCVIRIDGVTHPKRVFSFLLNLSSHTAQLVGKV